MSGLKVYYYPRCTTCTKAIRYLDKHEVEYSLIDLSEHSPSKQELGMMLQSYEGSIRKLFNTSGKRYRELDMKSKIPVTSNADLLALLSREGMMVKRPFLLGKDFALVGFREEEWDQIVA